MPLSTLKEKGQITLPSSIRRQIRTEKGDMFDFQVQQDDKVLMTRRKAAPAGKGQVQTKKRKDLSKWIGSKPGVFKTAEEVDQLIRKIR